MLHPPAVSDQPLTITGAAEPFSFEEAEDRVFRLGVHYGDGAAPVAGFYLTPPEVCGYKPRSGFWSANLMTPAKLTLWLPDVDARPGSQCRMGTYYLMVSGARGPVAHLPLEYRVTPTLPVRASATLLEFRMKEAGPLPPPQTLRFEKEGAPVRLRRHQRTEFDGVTIFSFRPDMGGQFVAPGSTTIGLLTGLPTRGKGVWEERWVIYADAPDRTAVEVLLRLVTE